MLVSTDQLAAYCTNPKWVIFDCRHDLADHAKGERLYREGHIPGAFFAPVETALSGKKNGKNGRHPLPTPDDFAMFLAAHGVSPSSTIVAYDDAGGLYAARLWWMARWIGLESVVLLDGGINRWIAENRKLTTDIPTAQSGSLMAKPQLDRIWDTATVARNLTNSITAILDARAGERYRGEVEPMDPVAGHIPGALNRFYKSNLNADLTFRPPAELKNEFAALLQNRAPENIAHSCGSGITACANLFAMEYAGLSGSKLYAGSWSEWVSDPTRPIARGAAT